MLALDFETFYDKEYSIKLSGTEAYVNDPRFDCYLVSAYGPGFEWVGHPKDFPWGKIHGETILAHNVNFDAQVLKRLRGLKIVPEQYQEKEWICTADMTAYFRCYRNLRDASKYLLGIELDKTVREHLKGKKSTEITGELDTEAKAYALKDAKCCYLLAEKYLDKWPKVEQEYSRILREACWRGLPVDVAAAEAAYKSLELQRFEIERLIPWAAEGEKILSHHALRRQGRKEGIPVPASVAKDDPVAMVWYEEYGEKYPWVKAYRDYRSCNAHLCKVETVYKGTRADGTLPLQILYAGTHTFRTKAGDVDDAGDKFNPLNMTKAALFGVDLRSLFVAPKGFTFVIADFAQIEARMLSWRVGDKAFLKRIADEGNIYQAYAKQVGWYSGSNLKKDDKPLYERSKMSLLQLGFQSGAAKFRAAAASKYGVELSEAESVKLVNDYRTSNPLVVNHWAEHQLWIRLSANHKDPTHEVVLKSGRVLVYFDPQWVKGDMDKYAQTKARPIRGAPLTKMYGGLLTENEIQATARDVMRDARVAVQAAGHNVVLDVYDELVCLVPEDEAAQRAVEIRKLMISSSPWAEGCPLDAEYEISKCYKK